MKTEDLVKRLRSRATDEDTVERATADRLEAILKAWTDGEVVGFTHSTRAALRRAITGES